jgi:hypothetical protein
VVEMLLFGGGGREGGREGGGGGGEGGRGAHVRACVRACTRRLTCPLLPNANAKAVSHQVNFLRPASIR